MATLTNPEFFESGNAGASAVVGFESMQNRVVRYNLNLGSGEQASHIHVLFDEANGSIYLGDGASFFSKINAEMSYYFAISTDPDAFANAGYENITDATGKAVFILYSGSWQNGDARYRVECEADVALYPNTQYYFWVYPGFSENGNDVYGWVGWSRSLTITTTLSGAVAYTVTYDANGGSGAPAAQTKYHGTDLVLSNTVPTKKGHSFLGWTTSVNGTALYQPGGVYSEDVAVTLYAVWKANRYTDTFNPNGGTGGGSFSGDYGTSYQAPTATRALYAITGWWTAKTGGKKIANPGQTITHNDANDTAYAQWVRTGYNIACDPNGGIFKGSAGITNIIAKPQASDGAAIGKAEKANTTGQRKVTLDANGGSCPVESLVSSGLVEHIFTGWYDRQGVQVYDQNGQCVEGTYWSNGLWVYENDLQIYAQYSTKEGKFSAVELPTATRAGYRFRGWSTNPMAAEGFLGTYVPAGNVTLYAVWGVNTVPISRFRIFVNTRGRLRAFRVLVGSEEAAKPYILHMETRPTPLIATYDGNGKVTLHGDVSTVYDGAGKVRLAGTVTAKYVDGKVTIKGGTR